MVGLEREVPTTEIAERLRDALALHTTVALLSDGELAAIDQAERDVEKVLLSAPAPPGDEWSELSMRDADLVIGVTQGRPDRAWMDRTSALRGCELLVFGSGVSETVLDSLAPRQVQVVADPTRQREAIEALARRLTGRALGVVLSGGGARALAHLGVLEELTAAGLKFDRLAGVSLGSLVAGAVAAGCSLEEIYETFRRGFVETNPTNDYAIPAFLLIRGAKTRVPLRG